MADKTPCAGKRWSSGWLRYVACTHSGKFEHDGKMWCGMHHPPSVKARKAARGAAYDAQLTREREARARAAAAARRHTIEGMTDAELLAECQRRGWEVTR